VKPPSPPSPSSTHSVPETVVKELGEVLAKLMKSIPETTATAAITPTITPTTITSSAFVVSDDTDAIVKIMDGTSTTTIPIVIPE
jgi:hypothetical protein